MLKPYLINLQTTDYNYEIFELKNNDKYLSVVEYIIKNYKYEDSKFNNKTKKELREFPKKSKEESMEFESFLKELYEDYLHTNEDKIRIYYKIYNLDPNQDYIVFHNWEEDKVILKEMLVTNIYENINQKKIKTAIKFLSEKNDFLKDKIISNEESFEDWYNGERMEEGVCCINLTNFADNTNKNELENYYDGDD